MELKYDLLNRLAITALLIVLLSLGAIGLFLRMSPAIETIIRENDVSLNAVQTMLMSISRIEGKIKVEEEKRNFDKALAAASKNITESQERKVISTIERLKARALNGDSTALDFMIEQLSVLAQINRQAMHNHDRAARRLGTSGAWGVVMLGLFTFGLVLYTISRTRIRIILPLIDLYETLQSVESGNSHRRSGPTIDAPAEILFIQQSVNSLLDDCTPGGGDSSNKDTEAILIRDLLEQSDEPLILVNRAKKIDFANKKATEALLSEDGKAIRAALVNKDAESQNEWIESMRSLAGDEYQLVKLKP